MDMTVADVGAAQLNASRGSGSAERAVARAQLSFKQWIENRAATPASIILIVSLVLRSASAWSYGAFSIAAFPPFLRGAFDSITGIGVALSMELLMSAAGAQWWRLRMEAARAPYDQTFAKQERQANAKELDARAQMYMYFTIFGAAASVGGGVFFAVSSTHNVTALALITDAALSVAIAFGVFFFGVIYEPQRPDHNRVAQDAVEGRLNDQALALAGRVAGGDVRPEHIAFLKGVVSPSIARRLDALIPRDGSIEFWDTPRIAAWLGDTSDSAQRDIRRKLQRAQNDPAMGIRQKPRGRGLEAPQTVILGIFQTEIERRMRAAPERTLTGESSALATGVAPAADSGAGQETGRQRRVSAPRAAESASGEASDTPDWLARLQG